LAWLTSFVAGTPRESVFQLAVGSLHRQAPEVGKAGIDRNDPAGESGRIGRIERRARHAAGKQILVSENDVGQNSRDEILLLHPEAAEHCRKSGREPRLPDQAGAPRLPGFRLQIAIAAEVQEESTGRIAAQRIDRCEWKGDGQQA
jgi:hypothetical protein